VSPGSRTRGFLFSFCYEDVTSDDHDFTNGLAGVIFGGRERKVDECGKIAMWAWAASRIMDYAETLPSLDLTKAVAVACIISAEKIGCFLYVFSKRNLRISPC